MLDHVTGKCFFSTPATITTTNGITAKLFRPWLRTEHDESILFVHSEMKERDRKIFTNWNNSWEAVPNAQRLNYLIKANIGQSSNTQGDLPIEDIQNALEISLEMDSLIRTLKWKILGDLGEIQAAMLKQVRLSNFDLQALAA